MEEQNQQTWEAHYTRNRSKLSIPDENVVRYFSRLIRDGELPENASILDLGCGKGRHVDYLQSLGLFTVGTDYSFEALRGQNTVLQSNAESLPFAADSLDIVLSWGVLHYLTEENAHKVIGEVLRILKSGGRFFFTLRASDDTHLSQTQKSGDLSGGNARLYSRDDLKDFVKGFSSSSYGFISRIPLGEENLIAHHMVEAIK